jgi:hypothetical protein
MSSSPNAATSHARSPNRAPRYATAGTATIRRHLIKLAGRIARHARGVTIHLPEHWPWQHPWTRLFTAAHAPPA